jgi:hypothetical protein
MVGTMAQGVGAFGYQISSAVLEFDFVFSRCDVVPEVAPGAVFIDYVTGCVYSEAGGLGCSLSVSCQA